MDTTFVYKERTNYTIKGDFYPVNSKKAPILIYIHGGGLIWGGRTDIIKEQVTLYNEAGFNVCSIDYRLAPETKLSEIKQDIDDAIRWLIEDGSNTYSFDPSRIGVIGSSAGGYLALLSGTFEIKPKVIVSFYGYGDILADWYTKPSAHFTKMPKAPDMLVNQLIQKQTISNAPINTRYAIYLNYRQQGKWIEHVTGLNPDNKADKEIIKQYCPIHQITKDYPTTLLIHGNNDDDVPYDESVKMSNALTEAGIKNELITIENGEHTFDYNMDKPEAVQAINDTIAFLNENLK